MTWTDLFSSAAKRCWSKLNCSASVSFFCSLLLSTGPPLSYTSASFWLQQTEWQTNRHNRITSTLADIIMTLSSIHFSLPQTWIDTKLPIKNKQVCQQDSGHISTNRRVQLKLCATSYPSPFSKPTFPFIHST